MGESPAKAPESRDPAGAAADQSGAPAHGHRRLAQGVVLATAAACFALFWGAGNLLHIPAERGFEASLLQQPGLGGKIVAVLVAVALCAACVVVGHLIAGRFWLYAGPFCGAVGLSALSMRGGPSRYVYLHAATYGGVRTVFLALLLELLLVYAVVAAAWFLIARQADRLLDPDRPKNADGLTAGKLQAVGAQVLITAFVILIFTPTDAKKEAIAGVFLGGFIGASVTEHYFRGHKPGAWLWLGPVAVGAIGFLISYFADAAGSMTGHLSGTFAALSRPLPLDYASAGVVGALLGHWSGAENPDDAVAGHQVFSSRTAMRSSAPTPPDSRPGAATATLELPSDNGQPS